MTIEQERIEWKDINHTKEFQRRAVLMERLNTDPEFLEACKVLYKSDIVAFCSDWGVTYDPRNVGTDRPTLMPLILFDVQKEMLRWMCGLVDSVESGVVDKSRDMGASWMACVVAWWFFLFHEGAAMGFGSRKFELVDNRDDPKTIFDKLRQLLRFTPKQFLPKPENMVDNLGKLVNKELNSSIVGEGGDSIGRGGRTTLYFVDESAFIEHPEKTEAALGENAKIQIAISTHNGTNTIFNRAVRNYPKHRVFILDWSRDPRKDQVWFDRKRKEYHLKGLDAEFAREIERNPRGSVDDLVIPAHWIKAAIDAHLTLGLDGEQENPRKQSGLDIADGGGDSNAVAYREGWILRRVETWKYAPDTAMSLDKTLGFMQAWGVHRLSYDCIGIGAGMKGDIRQRKERGESEALQVFPFNAAKSPLYKERPYLDGQTNGQVFRNMKAQAWWALRTRFLHTYLAVAENEVYDFEEMISIDSRIKDLEDLVDELTQPTYSSASGKIVIDKTPANTRSPNKGDGVMIAFAEVEEFVTLTQGAVAGLF